MTPVFLVLLLLIVVAVALVAAGRGGSMAEVEPDSPPVGLPEGPLTSDDLRGVRFPSALRGYRMHDVDEVLDRLGAELQARDARIRELEAADQGPLPSAPTSLEKG